MPYYHCMVWSTIGNCCDIILNVTQTHSDNGGYQNCGQGDGSLAISKWCFCAGCSVSHMWQLCNKWSAVFSRHLLVLAQVAWNLYQGDTKKSMRYQYFVLWCFLDFVSLFSILGRLIWDFDSKQGERDGEWNKDPLFELNQEQWSSWWVPLLT